MHIPPSASPFMTCTMCGHVWKDIQTFIEDPKLALNGYLPDFNQPGNGLIIVTHKTPGCSGSFSMRASVFRHLYTGPAFTEHNTAQHSCEGKCFIYDDFSKCGNACDMRWVRDIMLLISSKTFPAALIEKQPAETK